MHISRVIAVCVLLVPVAVYADEFVGAGVLPYAEHNGKLHVLLGYDSGEGWTNFGGSRLKDNLESLDEKTRRRETEEETAAREGFEETRRAYGYTEMLGKLRKLQSFEHPSIAFRTFTVRVKYREEKDIAALPIPEGRDWRVYREKKGFYWISLDDLEDIVKAAKDNGTDRKNVSLPDAPDAGSRERLAGNLFDSLSKKVFVGDSYKRLFP